MNSKDILSTFVAGLTEEQKQQLLAYAQGAGKEVKK